MGRNEGGAGVGPPPTVEVRHKGPHQGAGVFVAAVSGGQGVEYQQGRALSLADLPHHFPGPRQSGGGGDMLSGRGPPHWPAPHHIQGDEVRAHTLRSNPGRVAPREFGQPPRQLVKFVLVTGIDHGCAVCRYRVAKGQDAGRGVNPGVALTAAACDPRRELQDQPRFADAAHAGEQGHAVCG